MELSVKKVSTIFVLMAALITALYLYQVAGMAYTSAAPFILAIIAAYASRSFTRNNLKHQIRPLKWLITAPIFFALVGFGLWTGCILGALLLNNLVQSSLQLDFFEVITEIFSRGSAYALLGFEIGVIWAIPTTLILLSLNKSPAKNSEFSYNNKPFIFSFPQKLLVTARRNG